MLLTQKQLRFISEYLIDENGTQAAIRAGYSRKTARAIASENLKKPRIAGTIERYRLQARDAAGVDRGRIVQMLARLAFADTPGIFNLDGSLKHPKVWPSEVLKKSKPVKPNIKPPPRTENEASAKTPATDFRRLKTLSALARYLIRHGLLDA